MPYGTQSARSVYAMKAKDKSALLTRSRLGLLTLACLSVVAFLLSLFPIEQRFLWDEAIYLASADNLFAQAPYYSEARTDAPLFVALLHLGARAVSLDLFARLLAAVFFTAGVVFLYLLGAKLYGYLEGLSAALLMLLSPFFVDWAHTVSSHVPAAALALASVFFLFAHVEDRNKDWGALLSGALLAAAVLTHWVSGLAVICALYLVVSRRLQPVSLLLYVVGFLLALAPCLASVYITEGELLGPLLSASGLGSSGPVLSNFRANLQAVYQIAGPLVLLGLILRLLLVRRDQRSDLVHRDLPILLWFVLPFLVLSVVGQQTESLLTVTPSLFILAGRGFSYLRDSRLLLVRLFQQATRYSVRACRGRLFLRICGNFRWGFPAKRLASST